MSGSSRLRRLSGSGSVADNAGETPLVETTPDGDAFVGSSATAAARGAGVGVQGTMAHAGAPGSSQQGHSGAPSSRTGVVPTGAVKAAAAPASGTAPPTSIWQVSDLESAGVTPVYDLPAQLVGATPLPGIADILAEERACTADLVPRHALLSGGGDLPPTSLRSLPANVDFSRGDGFAELRGAMANLAHRFRSATRHSLPDSLAAGQVYSVCFPALTARRPHRGGALITDAWLTAAETTFPSLTAPPGSDVRGLGHSARWWGLRPSPPQAGLPLTVRLGAAASSVPWAAPGPPSHSGGGGGVTSPGHPSGYPLSTPGGAGPSQGGAAEYGGGGARRAAPLPTGPGAGGGWRPVDVRPPPPGQGHPPSRSAGPGPAQGVATANDRYSGRDQGGRGWGGPPPGDRGGGGPRYGGGPGGRYGQQGGGGGYRHDRRGGWPSQGSQRGRGGGGYRRERPPPPRRDAPPPAAHRQHHPSSWRGGPGRYGAPPPRGSAPPPSHSTQHQAHSRYSQPTGRG